ncbi:hypothetical protein EVAR_42672_1 [Eumeta japonica]|uniref:Uncharacterized protein n=1 Tax=Eumeta variegata TaxID=151549 RepID=A0A4C1X051_EUMVA|nr:hypothetical protein EVAR_42672_1 [Eumeta japonica]
MGAPALRRHPAALGQFSGVGALHVALPVNIRNASLYHAVALLHSDVVWHLALGKRRGYSENFRAAEAGRLRNLQARTSSGPAAPRDSAARRVSHGRRPDKGIDPALSAHQKPTH